MSQGNRFPRCSVFGLSIGHTGWHEVGAKSRFPTSMNKWPWEVTNRVIFILQEWKLKFKRSGWGVLSKLRWYVSMVSMSPDNFSECFLSLMKEDTRRPYAKQCSGLDATSPGAIESSGSLKDSYLNSSDRPPWQDKGRPWNSTLSIVPGFIYQIHFEKWSSTMNFGIKFFWQCSENVFTELLRPVTFKTTKNIPSFAFYVEYSREAAFSIYRT